jgi:hypothetical protein
MKFSASVVVLFATLHASPATAAALGMPFTPISGSTYHVTKEVALSSAPWVIPDGYVQRVVSDEADLDLYVGNDFYDMNTVNETGVDAGRYLYRTHEVRPGPLGRDGNSARVDGGSGGAVSVVDLRTGRARELVGRSHWEAVDGIVWTPWKTLLVNEEVHTARRPDPDAPAARSGLVYEIVLDPTDPARVRQVVVRPLLGALAHEGIEIGEDGSVYVVDEDRAGAIYRFVPQRQGDLSRGQLYALKVAQGKKTGAAEWVALDMRQVQISAREAAAAAGATPYCRPEDLERIGQVLYAALTCEDVDDPANARGPGAVLAIELGAVPVARFVVAGGKNAPVENAKARVTGFKHPDNLAAAPDGTLWIAEDNAPSDIWVYDPNSPDADGDGYRDGVRLFASLGDLAAEATGIYFPDAATLIVNIQHSGTGRDSTMAISRKR